jgi:hypothetical protein
MLIMDPYNTSPFLRRQLNPFNRNVKLFLGNYIRLSLFTVKSNWKLNSLNFFFKKQVRSLLKLIYNHFPYSKQFWDFRCLKVFRFFWGLHVLLSLRASLKSKDCWVTVHGHKPRILLSCTEIFWVLIRNHSALSIITFRQPSGTL